MVVGLSAYLASSTQVPYRKTKLKDVVYQMMWNEFPTPVIANTYF